MNFNNLFKQLIEKKKIENRVEVPYIEDWNEPITITINTNHYDYEETKQKETSADKDMIRFVLSV